MERALRRRCFRNGKLQSSNFQQRVFAHVCGKNPLAKTDIDPGVVVPFGLSSQFQVTTRLSLDTSLVRQQSLSLLEYGLDPPQPGRRHLPFSLSYLVLCLIAQFKFEISIHLIPPLEPPSPPSGRHSYTLRRSLSSVSFSNILEHDTHRSLAVRTPSLHQEIPEFLSWSGLV